MIHIKQEDMERERKDLPLIKKWLEDSFKINLRYAKKEEQLKGDLISVNTNEGYEVKIRYDLRWKDKDILIETKSNVEKDTWGWIYYSVADYLVYVFKYGNRLVRKHILYMKPFQKWWKNKGQYKNFHIKDAPNKGFITRNRVAPLKMIPLNVYSYSDFLDLPNRPQNLRSYF